MSRLVELVAARKAAYRAVADASDAARPTRDGYPADAPQRAEAEARITDARKAWESALDAWVLEALRDGPEPPPRRRTATAGPQLDLLLGAGGGR